MKSPRRSAKSSATGGWLGFAAGAICALAPPIASASVADTYYERSVMTAADERCRLFSPQVSSALAAGQAQARGAALRSGVAPETLQAVELQARVKAWSTACNSADMAVAAARVRSAFEPYSRQAREVYPGEFAGWTAERLPVSRAAAWNLSQTAAFGADRLAFGLAGQNGKSALLAVADFADGAQPYTARLIIRDARLAARPYLDRRQADSRGRLPLAARLAPRSSSRVFLAEARQAATAQLAPGGADGAIAFRFPAEAIAALAELDPREAVQIEFAFSTREGEKTRRAFIEVGDFAAGRAFLALSQR